MTRATEDPAVGTEHDDDLPARALLVVDEIAQLKALSDPIRLRILEALCGPPRTTKQVADRLGEKPTRLYHHVEALESAGLVHLVRTQPKRGTLEKYYQAVARQIRVDSSMLPSSELLGDENWCVLGALALDAAALELRRLGARAKPPDDTQAIVAHLRVRAPAGTVEKLHGRLLEILREIEAIGEEDADGQKSAEASEDWESFQVTLALAPSPDD